MRPSRTARSVCHLLRHRAGQVGDRELLRFEGTGVSFGTLEENSNRLANVLNSHGVQGGDRVAIMLPNGIEFPVAWLAVAKVGAVVVPVNISYRERDLHHVLCDSGARYAVAGPLELPILRSVQAQCPELDRLFVFGPSLQPASGVVDLRTELGTASSTFAIDALQPSDLVTIQYTSGTTGFPKGCMLTHEYWLSIADTTRSITGLGPEDVALTAQPFYYMDPTWNVVACMDARARLVILPRFSPSGFWKSIRDNGVTFFYCLGTMPMYLANQPPNPEVEQRHSVRLVMCSGIPPKLHAEFERRWHCPWREVYGTTELGAVLFVASSDRESVGSGTIGRPVSNREVMIVGDGGKELRAGEAGELLVRGPAVMLGYYNDPQATAEWMRNGWAHTGDLCVRDDGGNYRLVGRLKDMIRRAGENIAAVEVEAVLCEHPAVQAAACLAVADELRGEEVKAFVQLKPGFTRDAISPTDIIAFAKDRLAAFKVPRYVEYVNEFPLTPSERIAKGELRAQKTDQRFGAYDSATGLWG